jgi:hypothetical protein
LQAVPDGRKEFVSSALPSGSLTVTEYVLLLALNAELGTKKLDNALLATTVMLSQMELVCFPLPPRQFLEPTSL